MFHDMSGNGGWGWFWMVPMLLFWIAVLGSVIYAAVRLAHKHDQQPPLSQ